MQWVISVLSHHNTKVTSRKARYFQLINNHTMRFYHYLVVPPQEINVIIVTEILIGIKSILQKWIDLLKKRLFDCQQKPILHNGWENINWL